MGRYFACLGLFCGCGSVSGDTRDAALADVSIDAPADAAAQPPRCDPTKPFANAMPVPNINSPSNEFGARLSADELTIYFGSNRGGGAGEYDIYMATRASATSTFTTPTRIVSLATNGAESDPTPTPNGLGLIFSRSPMGNSGATNLFLASRSSPSADFTQITELTDASSGSEETNPYIVEGGNVLYFTSTRGGGYDIYRATRQLDGMYAQVEAVTQANTTGSIDAWPVGSEDGKVLLFASNRTGGNIWRVTRPTAGGSFGTAQHVAELETSDDEAPQWLSLDGCVLYIQRNGTSGLGGYDTWVAQRPL